MRIAQINMVTNGSTGKIMFHIASKCSENGFQVKTFSPYVFSKRIQRKQEIPENHVVFGSFFEAGFHRVFGSFFGFNGLFSQIATWQLIRRLKVFRPDIIQLHNLHGFCINLPMLFRYIKNYNIYVVWTLHDCWAFTGHCPHFALVNCEKWKNGCHHCPQPHIYPKMHIDTSRYMYKLKKRWFCMPQNMVLVTPSQWLATLVKQSFLRNYDVKVIHNGIDLNTFRPVPSDFRNKYGIAGDKYILLGVAFGWNKGKGLDVFVELSKRLENNYQIVLVGTNENIDKLLPSNIISIHSTQDQNQLAEIYTAADLFVNPTRGEVLGLVNIEANACGTPVVTFNTGGSPECIDETSGSVVDCDDIDAMEREIIRICECRPYSSSACVSRAKRFDMNCRFDEYLQLYQSKK